MKTFKRLLSAITATIMCINVVALTGLAVAEETCEEDMHISAWGANNTRNDLNAIDEEIVWDEQMLAAINSKNEQISTMKRSRLTYPTSYYVDVEWQQQINSYYCGPATASMILSVMDYTTPTQSQIAATQYLGTTTNGTDWFSGGTDSTASADYYNMIRGLNRWQYNQTGNYEWHYTVYPYNTVPSDSEYIDNLKFTIYMNYLVGINGLSSANTGALSHMPGYPALNVGHWLVCNGWTEDNEYWIVDPAAGISRFEDVEQKYKVSQNKLLAYINNGIVY